MKFRISHVPNTQRNLNFKVTSEAGDKHATFSICKELYMMWGKPDEQKLGSVMIAYIKKNGWSKTNVEITEAKSARSLNNYVSSLLGEKKGKK